MRMFDSIAGHFWTIVPALRHRARPTVSPAQAWSFVLPDRDLGSVALRGLFRDVANADAAVVIVHGLGGTTQTHYCVAAALAAEALGVASLRLALRGADRDGEDLYHAGIIADVDAAVSSPELARFARIYVLGFSLGGHVTLRYALDRTLTGYSAAARDPRVRAVAAVCAPLDLELAAQHMDSPAAFVYRRHVLTGLKAMYTAMALRRPVPTPLERVLAVRGIREWDELTVVPRHRFGSTARYYAQMSVGPALHQLAVPSLLVQHRRDPMVPEWTYRNYIEPLAKLTQLEVKWLPGGGHVGFPAGIDLGESGARGVEAQTLQWLLRH